MSAYRIDIRELIRDCGGATAVSRKLDRMGLPVQPGTPDCWASRGSMNVVYLAGLLAHAALIEGQPIDLNRYLKPVPVENLRAPRQTQRARRPAPAKAAS